MNSKEFQTIAKNQIMETYFTKAERLNGRLAMLGFMSYVLIEFCTNIPVSETIRITFQQLVS